MGQKLTEIVSDGKASGINNSSGYVVGNYQLFSEQYLEEPVISEDYNVAGTPTACSIAGIPVIDDF